MIRSSKLAALILALLALATGAPAAEIIKSPADDRIYAAFTLANGLGVIVVSDPDADKAAERLDTCQELVQRHHIRGFRAPSLLVSDAMYEAVGPRFAWDSSVPDTDTHTLLGPRRGCGTVFPFRRRGCLVLPLTMPADDRLLLLGYRGLELVELLRRKLAHVRQLGGLCHFLTHPEPHLFGKRVLRDLFAAVFEEILDTNEAWIATPSMVADYWESLTVAGGSNGAS